MARGSNTQANANALLFGARKQTVLSSERDRQIQRETIESFFSKINKSTYKDFLNFSYKAVQDKHLEVNLSLGAMMAKADGVEFWFNGQGQLSRKDGPAFSVPGKDDHKTYKPVEHPTASFRTDVWLERDVVTRADGPAVVVTVDGKPFQETWFDNGLKHRTDGPAVIKQGYREWRQKGELHREGGPAVEDDNGNQTWFQNGIKHREDGPAEIMVGKAPRFYWNGKRVSPKIYQEILEKTDV